MEPIVGEKFFWGSCLSKTLCSSTDKTSDR